MSFGLNGLLSKQSLFSTTHGFGTSSALTAKPFLYANRFKTSSLGIASLKTSFIHYHDIFAFHNQFEGSWSMHEQASVVINYFIS